ncbi:MAG: hypothetical protein KUG56_07220, partial [Kordiimonadaceae bacterium]|nr:hypothetical protein [Kordiimonadaceae bacterium]
EILRGDLSIELATLAKKCFLRKASVTDCDAGNMGAYFWVWLFLIFEIRPELMSVDASPLSRFIIPAIS